MIKIKFLRVLDFAAANSTMSHPTDRMFEYTSNDNKTSPTTQNAHGLDGNIQWIDVTPKMLAILEAVDTLKNVDEQKSKFRSFVSPVTGFEAKSSESRTKMVRIGVESNSQGPVNAIDLVKLCLLENSSPWPWVHVPLEKSVCKISKDLKRFWQENEDGLAVKSLFKDEGPEYLIVECQEHTPGKLVSSTCQFTLTHVNDQHQSFKKKFVYVLDNKGLWQSSLDTGYMEKWTSRKPSSKSDTAEEMKQNTFCIIVYKKKSVTDVTASVANQEENESNPMAQRVGDL